MKAIGWRSLRWKLLAVVLGTHAVVAGVFAFVLGQEVEKFQLDEVQRRSETLRVELAAALTAPVLERDYVALREIVEQLVSVAEIHDLVIVDVAGRELARAVSSVVPDAPEPVIHRFEVALPGATVRFGLDQTAATTTMRAVSRAIALDALLAMAAVAVLTLLVSSAWIRRIRTMDHVLDEWTAGRFAARMGGREEGDELDRLAQGFNELAQEVQRQMQSLVTAQRALAQTLESVQQERARLMALIDAMALGVLFVDRQDRVRYANQALRRIWLIEPDVDLIGQPAGEVLQRSGGRLAQPDHFSRLVLQVPGTQEISDSTELYMADGRVIVQNCRPVRDDDQRLIGRLWLYEDVTQERRNAEQLIYLAERDGLTGLYNRRRFEDLLERAVHDANRRHGRCALLLFDLDEFKDLNDHFGHRAGDALLVRVANELSTVVRRNETLARLGGDEFGLLIPDLDDPKEATALAERIVRAIARLPFTFEGRSLRMTASVGIAICPDHAADMAELVAAADIAMYQAKNGGKNGWRIYSGALEDGAIERLGWSDRVERALTQGGFVLHYQGVHDAAGRLLHVEGLLRMHDPDSGQLVGPGHFIPPAEKTGRIHDIDRWVVRAAVQQLAACPRLPAVAINVSGRTLADPQYPTFVLQTLRELGVEPRRLLIEVTETTAISDMHDANRLLEVIRPAGCRVCLDDFGAGFSSFPYLKHLSADVIKIDGQFVHEIARDRKNQLLVQAIVDVAHGFGMTTVAEFVEDATTVEVLRRIGVEAFQGYHFSRPQPDIEALLRQYGAAA